MTGDWLTKAVNLNAAVDPRARSDDDPRPASGEIALDDSNAFLERTDEVIEWTRLKAVPV
jgi:hypothetical protein